jgi:hypothetical protein
MAVEITGRVKPKFRSEIQKQAAMRLRRREDLLFASFRFAA